MVRFTPGPSRTAPLALGALAWACSGGASPLPSAMMGPTSDAGSDAGPATGCAALYPDYAAVMTLDQAVEPWRWPRAVDGQGNVTDLDLAEAFCNDDPDLDWSPFDLLLFVSVPGW